MNKIVVAIDGFSSCGKSTIARQLARDAGYVYVDTGAMYRAVGLFCIQNGIFINDIFDEKILKEKIKTIKIAFNTINNQQRTFLNDVDVENQIRTLEVGNAASKVSTLDFVRRELVRQQQQMGQVKGIVMDGRDIGTVVFPNAELKIFVTASTEIRAKRRFDELTAKGEQVNYPEVFQNIQERDHRDTHRTESPLLQAQDALLLDNTNLTKEQQQQTVMEWFRKAAN
ncbi:MAG: (d)CMP kinase [Prevotellaceae bacterium]|jgi:cytidylate kinase|nr:(d)CMP kinase [Prevotellaceae bacterium]